MVVVQLVEQLLPMSEICGSNPVIGKLLYRTFVSVNCIEKTKIKKKRPEMAHFLKKAQFLAVIYCAISYGQNWFCTMVTPMSLLYNWNLQRNRRWHVRIRSIYIVHFSQLSKIISWITYQRSTFYKKQLQLAALYLMNDSAPLKFYFKATRSSCL